MGSLASEQVPLCKYIKEELHCYIIANYLNVTPLNCDPLKFWLSNLKQFPLLCPVVLDILAAPASQAYVERILSLCGILAAGRQNRLEKNLKMRIFLKLNKNVLTNIQSAGNSADLLDKSAIQPSKLIYFWKYIGFKG